MFRNAITTAMAFTRPVVTSRREVSGVCSSSIGAIVVVNEDGWIVTAAHILTQLETLLAQTAQVLQHQQAEAAIRADQSLGNAQRRAKLVALGKLNNKATAHCSAWWGIDSASIVDAHTIESVDLGIARLHPFDPKSISTYPTFKRPDIGVEPGEMLCKLGFPFHAITPTWDAAANLFNFPAGALPLPCFPMEGMLTRFVLFDQPNPPLSFPLLQVETSTPGLRGQSGGPTFDEQGTVWAIQSNTAHLALGFDPPVPGGAKGQKEHQFLNVGRGVHPGTILGFLDSLGVKYNRSAY
jgi:hypothetical protein